MAKNVYNFEIFTNKKDQLKKIHKKQQQKEWARRILIIVLILFVAFIAYMLSNSRCEYYIYKEETETENNANVKYETFANGYIKYGQNGIEYQRNFGVADWNIPVSFQNPFLVKAEPYILLADKGGNTLMLFNTSGKVRDFTVRYPVVQASVSEQGTIEVILQVSFCLLSVNLMNSGKLKPSAIWSYRVLRWFPGILIFGVLFSFLVCLIFAFPGMPFTLVAWSAAAVVFVVIAGGAWLMRLLFPDKESRLEMFFLTNALTGIVAVIATVNGQTAVSGVSEVDWRSLAGVLGLVAAGVLAGSFVRTARPFRRFLKNANNLKP